MLRDRDLIVDWYLEQLALIGYDLKSFITKDRQDLFMIASKSSIAMVKKMMPYKNLTQTDDQGRTALHLAISLHNPEVIALLYAEGFDLNAKTHQGNTPLDIAIKEECPKVIPFLMEHGALFNRQSVDQLSDDSETKKIMQAYLLVLQEREDIQNIVLQAVHGSSPKVVVAEEASKGVQGPQKEVSDQEESNSKSSTAKRL